MRLEAKIFLTSPLFWGRSRNNGYGCNQQPCPARHSDLRGFFYFMTYEEQLLDPRWKAKREEVIRTTFGLCTVCGTTKNLQVHHKYYIDGRMAWEYPKHHLTTLCSDCHMLEHNLVPVSTPKHIKSVVLEFIESLS